MIVFIDRDGVINENRPDYVKTVGEFVIIPEALEGLAKLHRAGIMSVVISNQAGVGCGLINSDEHERINGFMLKTVKEYGGNIASAIYCTHAKDSNCDCRKPGIGLFLRAKDELDIELDGSYFIGDAASDIEAGQKAGLKTVFVLSGRGSAFDVEDWTFKPDHISSDLSSAIDWILSSSKD